MLNKDILSGLRKKKNPYIKANAISKDHGSSKLHDVCMMMCVLIQSINISNHIEHTSSMLPIGLALYLAKRSAACLCLRRFLRSNSSKSKRSAVRLFSIASEHVTFGSHDSMVCWTYGKSHSSNPSSSGYKCILSI